MSERTKWLRCNKTRPCPICAHPDWCSISEDGKVAMCARVESVKRCGDAGWLHRLDQPIPAASLPRPRPAPEASRNDLAGLYASWMRWTTLDDLNGLSVSLGVTVASLRRVGTAWAEPHKAFAFPMRDGRGELVGIRLRAGKTKFAVAGGHQGLFIPDDGLLPDQAETVCVVEGPTDLAAALDLGVVAIGRPSCSAYVPETVAMLRRRHIILIGDRDDPKLRPDGKTYRPGQEGAAALADALCGVARTVKVILPLEGKDLRAWLQAGASPAVLQAVIQNTDYWQAPKKKAVYEGCRQ